MHCKGHQVSNCALLQETTKLNKNPPSKHREDERIEPFSDLLRVHFSIRQLFHPNTTACFHQKIIKVLLGEKNSLSISR